MNFPNKFISIEHTDELLKKRLDNHIHNKRYIDFDEEDSLILEMIFSRFIKVYGSIKGESKACIRDSILIQMWVYENKNVWGYNIVEEDKLKEIYNKFLLKSNLFQILNNEYGVYGYGIGFLKSWLITVILEDVEKFLGNVTERDKEIIKRLYDLSPYYRKLQKETEYQYNVRIKGNILKLKNAMKWALSNVSKDDIHIANATQTGQLFRFKNYEKFVEFKMRFF